MSLILHFEPPPHWQAMRVSLETRRLFSAAKKAERQQCGMAQAGQLSTAVPLCGRYLQISTACIQKSVSEITDGHGFAGCSHCSGAMTVEPTNQPRQKKPVPRESGPISLVTLSRSAHELGTKALKRRSVRANSFRSARRRLQNPTP